MQVLEPEASNLGFECPLYNKAVPRIAIIGAGITGASTAHHLHKWTRLIQPLDTTVFEAEDQVGRRIRTAYVYDGPGFPAEAGAASLTDADWCLKEAMGEVGLRPARSIYRYDSTAVWDGHSIILRYDDHEKLLSRESWWQSRKWMWRYGLSFVKVRKMIQKTANSFSSFADCRAFLKLSQELEKYFSPRHLTAAATSMLEEAKVNGRLIDEYIRPEIRRRLGRDLSEVNTLSSSLVLRSSSQISVDGGNQRLPHRMLKISEAQTLLNTRVARIAPGNTRRWRLHTSTKQNRCTPLPRLEEHEIDIVVLTASLAIQGIAIDSLPSAIFSNAQTRSYTERHVTLFSTIHSLSPAYFNLSSNTSLPSRVLTSPRSSYSSSPEYTDDLSGIFSVTVANHAAPPGTDYVDELDTVYKVDSSRPIADVKIANLLGRQLQDSETLQDIDVGWVHRHVWPYAYPELTPAQHILNDIEIAPDLYYTAAAEEVTGSMEMGCRMCSNLAQHMFYTKWLGETYP